MPTPTSASLAMEKGRLSSAEAKTLARSALTVGSYQHANKTAKSRYRWMRRNRLRPAATDETSMDQGELVVNVDGPRGARYESRWTGWTAMDDAQHAGIDVYGYVSVDVYAYAYCEGYIYDSSYDYGYVLTCAQSER